MSTNEIPSATDARWSNITTLLARAGHVTIGRVAHIEGAAIAADEHSVLVTVVRRPDESFDNLLQRLDHAIGQALYEGVFTNEVEGGRFEVAGARRPRRKSDQ